MISDAATADMLDMGCAAQARTNHPTQPGRNRISAFCATFGMMYFGLAAATAHAQRTWHPTITAVAPNIVTLGGTVTLSGTDLNPPGWQVRVTYQQRYGSGSSYTLPVATATKLTFAAESMREEGVAVEWVALSDSAARVNPIPAAERRRVLTSPIVVQGPADITLAGSVLAADAGPPFAVFLLADGGAVIKGKFLRRTSMPAVTFAGTPLVVLQHTYEANGSLMNPAGTGFGADRLVFAPPSQPATGWLVVDNTLGRDSALVTMGGPPVVQQLRLLEGSGSGELSPANQLQRGRTYVIRGRHLSISHQGPGSGSIKRGIARLGTVDITPIFASDTNLVFKVPELFSEASTTLTVVTAVGNAQVGVFAVANRTSAFDVTGVSQTAATLVPGQALQFFATVAVPPNTPPEQLGTLKVSVPASAASVIKVQPSYPVSKTSTEIKIVALDVQSSITFPVTVAHESSGMNGHVTQSQQVMVTVRPPRPLGFEPSNGVITAGTGNPVRVMFEKGHRGTSTMFVLLSSSNPNIVNVPSSATIIDGRALFTATVPPQPQPATVLLTATIDGVTISQPFTVQLPTVQQVTIGTATATPGAMVSVVATLSGDVPINEQVAWTVSDTSLAPESQVPRPARCPNQDITNRCDLRVTRALAEQRQVTVTAQHAGGSKSATVTLVPLLIADLVATPTIGRPGTTLSITALLTGTPTIDRMTMQFASADTSLAAVSQTGGGVTSSSKAANILLKGSPSGPRQVPITATLLSSGVIVSMRTITITVTP